MIEHGEAREFLELAAVEPGGLERMAAGDTPEAAALAAHLADCSSCSAEADRLRASAGLIRAVVIEAPPPELRKRTLALVREVGRLRLPASSIASSDMAPARLRPASRRRSFRAIGLPLGIAAALVLAVAGTAVVVSDSNRATLQASQDTTTELARVTTWTLRVGAEPGARRVGLVSPTGSSQPGSPSASGTLLFSPTTTDLVVVAQGLAPAPAGSEYRCWLLLDGARWDIGLMDTGGSLAYWIGPVGALRDLPAGTAFGVSLAQVNGAIDPGPPALAGSVGG